MHTLENNRTHDAVGYRGKIARKKKKGEICVSQNVFTKTFYKIFIYILGKSLEFLKFH